MMSKNTPLPDCVHRPDEPTDYLAWHDWADKMAKTHVQIRCQGCGLYKTWVPKKKRAPKVKE